MAQELIVQNATYQPDQKRLEIVIALVEFRILERTVTVVDKDTGLQVAKLEEVDKDVLKAFGETLYCPDVQGHTHEPIACAKAHAEYAAKKAKLAGSLSDWKAQAKPLTMTPADRKLE